MHISAEASKYASKSNTELRHTWTICLTLNYAYITASCQQYTQQPCRHCSTNVNCRNSITIYDQTTGMAGQSDLSITNSSWHSYTRTRTHTQAGKQAYTWHYNQLNIGSALAHCSKGPLFWRLGLERGLGLVGLWLVGLGLGLVDLRNSRP